MTKNVRDRRRPAETTQQNPDVSVEPKPATETSDRDREEIDEEDVDEPDTEEAIAEEDCGTSPAAQLDSETVPGCTPKTARKRLAYALKMVGLSQKKIAKLLGVSTRTVRNWLQDSEAVPPGLVESLDPMNEVNRRLLRLTMREAKYREYQEEAEARRELGRAMQCERELERIDEIRSTYLAKIGLFDRCNLAQLTADAFGNGSGSSVLDLLEEIIARDDDAFEDDGAEDA